MPMYKLLQKLSPAEFKETFAGVNKEDHQRPPHPWDLLFREGKCTKQQLQGWAKERYYFVKQVPVKEYAILHNCPYPEVRRVWLTKAIEEEGEDIIGREHGPHPAYWVKLCEALGLSRDYVIRSEPLAGVKFAVDVFVEIAHKSWLLGIAVSEGEDTAKAMIRDIELFRKHYSWVPEEALEFYKLHSEVDVGHGNIRLDILAKYCDTKELQEDCINAQLLKNNIRRVMSDAIYMAYVVQGLTCGNGVG
jgi:pyrroloquinoline-quinone synthase